MKDRDVTTKAKYRELLDAQLEDVIMLRRAVEITKQETKDLAWKLSTAEDAIGALKDQKRQLGVIVMKLATYLQAVAVCEMTDAGQTANGYAEVCTFIGRTIDEAKGLL